MSANTLSNLEPKNVWNIFEEITKTPRPSKHEEKIVAWIKEWAKEHKIACKEDSVGNLLLSVKATKGKEKAPTLVLQGHTDMVCQKDSDTKVDCEKDSLIVKTDNKIVYAEGTSLGADNGIGVAIALAALLDEDLEHGPLEVLLTVDEESGLTGALKLKQGFFTGEYLLNIDSEDIGKITISSAGGGDTILSIPVETVTAKGWKGIRIAIKGLQGGHSGVDIDKKRLNAIKVGVDALTRVQDYLKAKESKNNELALSTISGGTVHNAIPRDFSCDFLVNKEYNGIILKLLKQWKRFALSTMKDMEPNISIEITEIKADQAFTAKQSGDIISLLFELHHGVVSYSKEIEGLVQTSNNLASVKTVENKVEILVSTRSSVDEELVQAREKAKQLGERFGAEVELADSYPGWRPDLESPFLKIVKGNYEEVLGKEVELKAIHAGLECGFFLKINPKLQVTSIGPTIKNAHSTQEYVEIESVQKIWKVVKGVISSMDKL